MKKQFFRVKQLADQTFLGADKSEGLNHAELHKADHKVEYIRGALTAISKKIPAPTPIQEENEEKRMKKYPEYLLGSVLLEQAKKGILPGDSEHEDRYLFQQIIQQCGMTQQELAKEQAEHEQKVETMVSAPIQKIIDNELPSILKHKRSLSKYILDKDSAKNRLQAVSKNGNQRETLKEEHEEAELKVDQSRDLLAAEMFSLLRKENELAQYMLQILKLQRGYHESALKNLEKVIPELEKKIGDSCVKVVFGIPLEEHLRVTRRRIAFPLELCICILTELGLSEEGLFRVAGGAARIKRLKLSLDSGCFEPPLVIEYRDVHVIASTLKLYLRELPDPLLTKTLYKEWIKCVNNQHSDDQKVAALKEVLKKLPSPNRENLTYLMQFLSKLSKHPENKMSSMNIAICIAPNLLWSNDAEANMHMNNCSMLNMIADLMITHADKLFPEDLSSYLHLTIGELVGEPESEFARPVLNNVKLLKHDSDYHTEIESFNDTSSPKPQIRSKKRTPAPIPPAMTKSSESEFPDSKDRSSLTASYPSGSSTLNRPVKVRADTAATKTKASIGVNTDQTSPEFSARRKSLAEESSESAHKASDVSKAALVIDDPKMIADHKYVVSQTSTNIQVSKAKPVQPVQVTKAEKPLVVSNQTQKSSANQSTETRPVAAPRIINPDIEKSTLRIENPLTKSLNTMESIDADFVQIRKKDDVGERSKPMIPARPASLRGVRTTPDLTLDPALQKTQCLVYNLANKQQPSIVNIQNRFSGEKLGHDTQIAEKEKFLGHQPVAVPAPRLSLENKFNDINSNCENREKSGSIGSKPEVPSKPAVMKSTEKLNQELHERFNGNSKPSHARTRSDGSLIDISSSSPTSPSALQTPPSPRGIINKPTQPPPLPPVVTQRPKSEPDSTDL